MPNFTDEQLATLAATLRDQIAHTRDWHTQDRAQALALVEDLQKARKDNDTLNEAVGKLQEHVEQLNGTIERHRVVNRKHIEQFATIAKEAREILARNRVYSGDRTIIHRIIAAASAIIPSEPPEESDNP